MISCGMQFLTEFTLRCLLVFRGGQNVHVFRIAFFAEIESLQCPDLRPSQIKSQLCLVILK